MSIGNEPAYSTTGWVVVDPYGEIVFVSLKDSMEAVTADFVSKVGGNWPWHCATGYDCLPCTITVSEDER